MAQGLPVRGCRAGRLTVALCSTLAACGLIPPTNLTIAAEASPAADTNLRRAAELIPRLGDPHFQARDAASGELSKMGIEIKPVLAAALKDADPEIRARAGRLLTAVIEADFQHRLAVFADDVDDAQRLDLPGWSRFKSTIGADRAARALFVEMQRAEPSLMAAYDQGADAVAKSLQLRIHAAAATAPMMRFGGAQNVNQLSTPRVAALFFVASDKEIKIGSDSAEEMHTFYYFPPAFSMALNAGPQSDLLKRILGAWIGRDASPDTLETNLQVALQMNLKEGLAPALAGLQRAGLTPQAKMTALIAIDKFGGKDHLPAIAPSLKDTDVCRAMPLGPNEPIKQLEVRDVALAVSIRLSGEESTKFGMKPIQQNQILLYQPQTMMFNSPAERDAAFKKWADHLSAAKKTTTGIKEEAKK